MVRWGSWILTGLAMAVAFLAAMSLLTFARWCPRLARWLAGGAIGVFALRVVLQMAASRWAGASE